MGSEQTVDRVDFCRAGAYNGTVVVLALDTATRAGSVALMRGDDLLLARPGNPDRPHATRLPADLLSVVSDAGLMLNDVDRLAVCVGPGAFTGLRIGIAAMQGLAFATGLPVAGVSAFDALAAAAGAEDADAGVGVWMEAGRGEVFAARYEVAADSEPVCRGEPLAAPPAVVLASWEADGPLPRVWTGDGASRHAGLIRSLVEPAAGQPFELLPGPLLAEWVARLARVRPAGRPHTLRPVYVRRSDAELARDRQMATPPDA